MIFLTITNITRYSGIRKNKMGKRKSLYDEKKFVKHKALFDALAKYDKTGILQEIKPAEMKCNFEDKCKNKA